MSNERTALLNGEGETLNGHTEQLPFAHRILDVMKAEGEPSWAASFKHFLFGSWLNILLVFIPLSVCLLYALRLLQTIPEQPLTSCYLCGGR
ncbi:hypothetical protein DFH11DRAFT_1145567 [Phellopilus nigrolimitatus]|nr:hypothetical protein DFH11DRAFT_1145567 [Phellopilus nigrolimitatus]